MLFSAEIDYPGIGGNRFDKTFLFNSQVCIRDKLPPRLGSAIVRLHLSSDPVRPHPQLDSLLQMCVSVLPPRGRRIVLDKQNTIRTERIRAI